MQRSKGLDILIACLFLLTAAGRVAQANVFASALTAPPTWDFGSQGPLTITYRLNEPATDVRIEVFRGASPEFVIVTLVGSTHHGLNSATWDGRTDVGTLAISADDYQFRVIASHGDGHIRWDDITPLIDGVDIPSTTTVDAQGVAAQTDPSNPDFGCVFVNNSQPQVSSDFSKQGVYVLNADLSWFGGTAASAYAAGKNDPASHWDTQDDWSPNKIKIGLDDGCTYVGDSGAYERSDDLYVSTGTQGGTATPVLVVKGPNHGRVPAAISIGTGDQRALYGIDRDQGDDAYPDFFRWDVGTIVKNYTGQPVKLFDAKAGNPTGMQLWSLRDFDLGTTGERDAYFANRTFTPSEVRVFRTSLDGSKLVWSKTGDELDTMCPSLGNHPYCCAIAVDEASDRLAVMMDGSSATDAGKVVILRASDGTFLAEWQASPAGEAATRQGKSLDFDAAGNLLTGSLTDQRLRLWSPPDGPNSFTTTSATTISITGHDPGAPPTILSAVSRKTHGNLGAFDIAVGPKTKGVECRADGVTTLVVTFDTEVKQIEESPSSAVVVTTNTLVTLPITSLSIQGNELTVHLPENPAVAELEVLFPGIGSLADTPCASALNVAVLTGDMNQDGKVNVVDLISTRNTLNEPMDLTNFTCDMDCDGQLNVIDLITVRSMLNKIVDMAGTP